jgi:DNA-binding CsgD family transcriptional regulator
MTNREAGRRARGPLAELTAREREILDLVARGMSNAAIAQALVLSQTTVRNYVSTIFEKLQLHDRSTVIVAARDAGFGSDHSGRRALPRRLVPGGDTTVHYCEQLASCAVSAQSSCRAVSAQQLALYQAGPSVLARALNRD